MSASAPEKVLSVEDIRRKIYKGKSHTIMLLSLAFKEGKIKRAKKGYYVDDEQMQAWIEEITK